MSGVSDLIGHHGTANACMFGPADYAGFEEGSVNDQLATPDEQIEQAGLTLWSVKFVLLLHSEPRHPPTFGGQCVSGASELFLLHEKFLACSLPLLRGHYLSI